MMEPLLLPGIDLFQVSLKDLSSLFAIKKYAMRTLN